MKAVTGKLTWPRQPVVDLYLDNIAAASACMLLLMRLQFVGCEISTVCFKEFLFGYVEMFAKQTLMRSRALALRQMCRLDQRSWYLQLIELVLDWKNYYYGMPHVGFVLQSVFPSTSRAFS